MTKVWITVLCGGERNNWVNPWLVRNLLQMQKDERFQVTIDLIQESPVEYARNVVLKRARDEVKPDWVIMIDNDQAFEWNVLDAILLPWSDTDGTWIVPAVVGVPTMQRATKEEREQGQLLRPNTSNVVLRVVKDGRWGEIERIGGGTLIINSAIFTTIPGPWFQFEHDNDELHTVKTSEDFHFSDLVRKHGFSIWITNKVSMHFHTVELLTIAKHTKI